MKILASSVLLFGINVGSGNFATTALASDLDRMLGPFRRPASTIDIHGRVVAAEFLRDQLAVISFVSAGCTILCVTRTMDLDRLAKDLPASLHGRVVFIAIDTDPAADDSTRLRAFVDGLLGPEPQLRFLVPDAAATKAVTEELHYPAAFLPEPPPTVLLFDRRGRVAMSYGGTPLDTPRIARDLAVLDTFTEGLDRQPGDAANWHRPSR